MTTPKRIKVEIGIPSQIEPGQEVEVLIVPGITAHRVLLDNAVSDETRAMFRQERHSPMSSDGADCA